jgi:A118 family predicted phage portal protein
MIEEFSTKSDIPLFSIIKPNIVNTIDGSNGLGMSVFANSIDNLQGVDLCYNNFNRDFKLGGKKVFLNDSLTTTTESGAKITPDDTAQQLFIQFGDDFIDKDGNNNLIQEFNPSLRVQENIDGLQAQLDYLSFKCGFGTKHYQFNAGAIITATQYVGDKQELMQNASKNSIVVERALKALIKAILWAGKNICGIDLDEDPEIKVNFDDSYIVDTESALLSMQQDVASGLIRPEIYLAKKYGVTEKEALKMMPAASTTVEDNPFGDNPGNE